LENFTLPIPFEHTVIHNNLSDYSDPKFIVCAMATTHQEIYSQQANRLFSSCQKYHIPCVIYSVPKVHQSTSLKGSNDPAYTKANFIYYILEKYPNAYIFYVDADVLFMAYPEITAYLIENNIDFAVYNWLSAEHNEKYIPIDPKDPEYQHLYFYFGVCAYYSTKQLICGGCCQIYRNSKQARNLLQNCFNMNCLYPDLPDDEILDYTYNNFILDKTDCTVFWLDASYCRCYWWIYVKPVVLHPDIHSSVDRIHVTELNNLKRAYFDKCEQRTQTTHPPILPIDWIINVKNKQLSIKLNFVVDLINGKIRKERDPSAVSRPLPIELYIYPFDYDLNPAS